jgi:hypothetical protein
MKHRMIHAWVVIGLTATLAARPCLGQVENASYITPQSGPLNTNNYLRVPALTDNYDGYTVRGDARLNATQRVFVRYIYSTRERFVPGAFGGVIDGTAVERVLLARYEEEETTEDNQSRKGR